MSIKAQGAVLLVLGSVVVILALSADSIGVGSNPGLGLLQIAAAVIGLVTIAAGLVKLRSRPAAPAASDRPRGEER